MTSVVVVPASPTQGPTSTSEGPGSLQTGNPAVVVSVPIMEVIAAGLVGVALAA